MLTGARGGYKKTVYDDEGRWLADYIMDSMDESTAQVVKLTTVDGTAYSTNGIDGPYETAIMANGTILGKFIEAHSVTTEKISQDYTSQWEDADTRTLNTARSEFTAADAEITARVSQVETDTNSVKTNLEAEIQVRADQIAQTVKRGEINSTIKQTAETIYIESNKFGWNSTNSSLTTDGTLTAKNATFTNCTVTGSMLSEEGNRRTEVRGGYVQYYTKVNNAWKAVAIEQAYMDSSKRAGLITVLSEGTAQMSLQDKIWNVSVNLKGRQCNMGLDCSTGNRVILFNSDQIWVNSNQTYSGDIYLTYGNGGKIYLIVKNGLICGWHL